MVWSRRAEVTPLPTSTGAAEAISAAMAINPRREVVGFETEAGGTVVINPVRWTPAGEIQTFPQFRGTFVAINSSGLAVGRYEVQIEPNRFDWNVFVSIRQGRVVTLGPGIPVAVNDRGAIVGTTEIEGVTQAVLWFVRP